MSPQEYSLEDRDIGDLCVKIEGDPNDPARVVAVRSYLEKNSHRINSLLTSAINRQQKDRSNELKIVIGELRKVQSLPND